MGLSKKSIAKANVVSLNQMKDFLYENGNWVGSAVMYPPTVQSANNYMKAIVAGGEQIPGWILGERRYLAACGWRIPS